LAECIRDDLMDFADYAAAPGHVVAALAGVLLAAHLGPARCRSRGVIVIAGTARW
jgi:hypothetical protein